MSCSAISAWSNSRTLDRSTSSMPDHSASSVVDEVVELLRPRSVRRPHATQRNLTHGPWLHDPALDGRGHCERAALLEMVRSSGNDLCSFRLAHRLEVPSAQSHRVSPRLVLVSLLGGSSASAKCKVHHTWRTHVCAPSDCVQISTQTRHG